MITVFKNKKSVLMTYSFNTLFLIKLTLCFSCVSLYLMRRMYKYKRCPRCNTKNQYNQFKCTECGLIFSRVENGSNKIAKELILAGKKNETIKAPGFPKDVKKSKFLLLCGFLGFFGAHNFYVGRYFKAIFQLIIGLLSVVMTFLSSYISNIDFIMSYVFLPIAIDGLFWAFDFVDAIFNKYRIPVAVDFSEGKELLNKGNK